MKTRLCNSLRRGFTLVELIVAMAITAILVLMIMQLTGKGVDLWKKVQEDVSAASASSLALEMLGMDLQSTQMKTGTNEYEWMFAESETVNVGTAKGLKLPKSARLAFFTCAPDRNPAVSSRPALRTGYRNARNRSTETQGDVCTVCYELKYHDEVLNLGPEEKGGGVFPMFSVYRTMVLPRPTFESLLGQRDFAAAYRGMSLRPEENFLCDKIIEFSLVFNVRHAKGDADIKTGRAEYEHVSVPVLSSRGSAKPFSIRGTTITAGTNTYKNARVVSATVAVTVLSEKGVQLVEQIRRGQRKAPKAEDFFRQYTTSFSRTVSLPDPL